MWTYYNIPNNSLNSGAHSVHPNGTVNYHIGEYWLGPVTGLSGPVTSTRSISPPPDLIGLTISYLMAKGHAHQAHVLMSLYNLIFQTSHGLLHRGISDF